MMTEDLKELLRAFNAHAVEYLVVGGYAYGVHAEPRATKDLDLFIRADEENSKAVYRALARYGAPLDGLQQIDGVSFEEAWEHRIEGLVDGEIPTSVISRDDLIRNKVASGREQDILDVKKLRAAVPKQHLQRRNNAKTTKIERG